MQFLDTDVLIDVQRRHPPAVRWFGSLTDTPAVPVELIQAAENAVQVRRAHRLVSQLPIVWPTEADCARALADFSKLHLSHKLGLIDALIAATAVGQGATLCTFNVKHYRPVPGLTLTQPYKR